MTRLSDRMQQRARSVQEARITTWELTKGYALGLAVVFGSFGILKYLLKDQREAAECANQRRDHAQGVSTAASTANGSGRAPYQITVGSLSYEAPEYTDKLVGHGVVESNGDYYTQLELADIEKAFRSVCDEAWVRKSQRLAFLVFEDHKTGEVVKEEIDTLPNFDEYGKSFVLVIFTDDVDDTRRYILHDDIGY